MSGSTKEQKQIIMILVLLVAFAVSIFMTKKKMDKMPFFSGSGYAVAGINVEELKKKFKEYQARKISYDGKPYRDPMKKPLEVTMLEGKGAVAKTVEEPKGTGVTGGAKTGQPKPEGQMDLQGIIWGTKGAKNLAIISGKVVYEGEMIGGSKVISIREGKVVLEQDGKQIEIKR